MVMICLLLMREDFATRFETHTKHSENKRGKNLTVYVCAFLYIISNIINLILVYVFPQARIERFNFAHKKCIMVISGQIYVLHISQNT